MKVSIEDITALMRKTLRAKGFSDEDADFLIAMYLGGELRGHTSHGLASFPGFVRKDFSQLAEPEVIKETSSLFMIDAKSNPGALIGKRAADEAMERAAKEGAGTAIIKNMSSWLRPGAIAQYIADQGYMSIVVNNGGLAAIAPPGGYDPTLGTNPIAYGIPTDEEPLVVDMATSKRAWGQVRLADKYGTELPPDTFYNDKGEVTREPSEAFSVKPFGDHKGYALALLVEVLCGSLTGMDDMMLTSDFKGGSFGGEPHVNRGGMILVIDPRQTTELSAFKAANTELLQRIKTTSPLKDEAIRIPGEEAGKRETDLNRKGSIDIPEELWQELQSL